MNKEERVKLVFETFSKIAGFEIKPDKEFCVIINGIKYIYKMGENFQLYYYYNWPLGNYNKSENNILAFFNAEYQFEEIKEPLLPEESKNFLRQFEIEELEIILAHLNMYNKTGLLVNVINLNTVNFSFDGLKEGKKYTGKELGL